MDSNKGRLYPIDDAPTPKKGSVKTHEAKERGWLIFALGEVVKIKGCFFQVLYIKHTTGRMILRAVAKPREMEEKP